MNDKPTDDTTRYLIGQKISYVNSTVNVCMLWWVSSIVFCAYVLAAVWSMRAVLGPGYIAGLGVVHFLLFHLLFWLFDSQPLS
jgi:hypothetical protein